MLEKVFIFILFLTPLVFFHELGHFLFARLFGVRVEVFSIGFGPKIFKKVWGDTEYAFSLIPLGGYVKMFGDDPFKKDEIPVEERRYSFNHKGKWARFWIVLGGPLANFILAFAIFYSLLLSGEKVPEVKVGTLTSKSILYKEGFRTADTLVKVNQTKVLGPADLAFDDSNEVNTIEVRRLGEIVKINTSLKMMEFFNEFSNTLALRRKPYFVDGSGSVYVIETPNQNAVSLEELNEFFIGKEVKLFKFTNFNEEKEISDLKDQDKTYLETITVDKSIEETLSYKGLKPIGLQVKSISMNSAADKAGLKSGDFITKLNNISLMTFDDLKSVLQKTTDKEVEVTYLRNNREYTAKVIPEVKELNGEKVKLIGVYSNAQFFRPKHIETGSSGVIGSIPKAVTRTWEATVKTIDGFKKLITAEVSVKNIGGPLSIGKVASDSLNISLSYFFQLMAAISINLGIINLFPIPVLDGGHIMFIILEIINRGPLSRRKMEMAQQFGLSLLLMLMVGAIFNDFTRFFS